LALLRNEGGSVGTSVAQTIQERRETFHELRLGEHLDIYSPNVVLFAQKSQAALYRLTGDPAAAKRMSVQILENLRLQQAGSLAYFDVFWVTGVISFTLVFLVLLMKRSVPEKGAHVGAE
jgi:DHA2 family multidrug resistance protein